MSEDIDLMGVEPYGWFKDCKYKVTVGEYTFGWNTAKELGYMVGESGCELPNPYDPNCEDYEHFEEYKTRGENLRHMRIAIDRNQAPG